MRRPLRPSVLLYNDYFGFKAAPFSIAPNPRFLYLTERHREALAHLLYGIRSDGGFVLLTGEVGTGKTTVCRSLLQQLPDHVDTAFVLNPRLTVNELLAVICDDLGIGYETDSLKKLLDSLNAYLLDAHAKDRKTVLIIDEAQNLSRDVLEQLRLLTNLETNEQKLLQIILLGQPELLEILASQDLRQLAQRITARFHLTALSRDEVAKYIAHRLEVAGGSPRLFTARAMRRVHKLSGGIPRLINIICDRSLLGVFGSNGSEVTPATVNAAGGEVIGKGQARSRRRIMAGVGVALALILAVGIGYNLEPRAFTPVGTAEADGASSRVMRRQDPTPPTGLQDPSTALARVASVITPTASRARPTIDSLTGYASESAAFADIFAAWGIGRSTSNSPPCKFAASKGLACMSRTGAPGQIIALDRPVILQLDEHRYVSWTRHDDGRVTLGDSEITYQFDIDQLSALWPARFTLVWRTPPGYTRPLARDDIGAAVDWLAFQLRGGEVRTGLTLDETLESELKDFQRLRNLPPSGVADARTWIALNGRGDDVPRLKSGSEQ